MNKSVVNLGHSFLVLSLSAIETPAFSQTDDPTERAAEADVSDNIIVVTARKREEDILRTPVTVLAITSEDIAKRGIVTMSDVADNTPGLNINNNSAGRADRSFQQIVLRGFTPSTTLATTTSMFIDGVAVSSPSAFTAISDPDRIEVLKGPQSAYFGRNTFAGAVNIVNKLPTGVWSGSVAAMVGTRNNYQLQGSLEGPIIDDQLTFRASFNRFSKDGSWRNAYDGATLGDQSTTSATLLLVAKPTDGLTFKAFGIVSQDKDGPAAQTRLAAYNVVNGSTVVIQNQSNCVINRRPYICGTAPQPINPISANTHVDAFMRNFINNPRGRLLDPKNGTEQYGLKRRYRHFHGTADVEIGNALTGSLLAGYNFETWSALSDLDSFDSSSLPNPFGAPGSRSYFDFPFLVERKQRDWSAEGRLSYDSGPIRGVVGASYLAATSFIGLGGGNGPLGITTFSQVAGKNRATTAGAFFGVTYDATSQLSVSLEGRYQIDTLFAYASPTGQTVTSSAFIPAGTYAPDQLVIRKSYRKFLPRAIVNYQITPRTMVYASIAKGVNPGDFNAGILGQSDALQRAAVAEGLSIEVFPETVINYEAGVKGRMLDNRISYALSGFYSQWRNQINSTQLAVNDPSSNTGVSFITGSANSGSVDLYGAELEFTARVSDLITLNAAGAVNLSSIQRFVNPSITALTGVTDFHGKEQPNNSKYSATAGVQFGGELNQSIENNWFLRADWVFKSGVWSNQANVVRTSDAHKINLRTGVSLGNTSIEFFVRNVLNNKAYTSIADNWTFNPTFSYLSVFSGLNVGLPELRTAGVQLKAKF